VLACPQLMLVLDVTLVHLALPALRLPPALRQAYGLPWGRSQRLWFAGLSRLLPGLLRLTPPILRQVPQARAAQRRLSARS